MGGHQGHTLKEKAWWRHHALARIPAKWNHFAEKDSRQINRESPYRQSFQLWRDLL